jgi:hypothetical protein
MSKVDQIIADLKGDPKLLEKLAANIESYHLTDKEKAELGKALRKNFKLGKMQSKTEGGFDFGKWLTSGPRASGRFS